MNRRFTEEQIIGLPNEADAEVPVKDLCCKHGFRDAAFYGWRTTFQGTKVEEATRLKALEQENTKLKRLLAESLLDIWALKVRCAESAEPADKSARKWWR